MIGHISSRTAFSFSKKILACFRFRVNAGRRRTVLSPQPPARIPAMKDSSYVAVTLLMDARFESGKETW